MKKLGIICPWGYPVPAVKGGAVETLMQFFIEENEKDPQFEITLLTTADEEAEKLYSRYEYTKCIPFKTYGAADKAWDILFRGIKKVTGKYIPCSPRFIKVLKYIDAHSGDLEYLLVECGYTYMLPLIAKVYPKEKILAHIHWPGDTNKKIDECAGHVLTVSGFVARQWQKRVKDSREKIYIWENCCNDDSFSKELPLEEKLQLKKELGIQAADKVILYIGRIVPEKGLMELVEALEQIKAENIVLLMIGKANFGADGETPFEKKLSERIRDTKKKIIQLGFVHNNELYKYYGISDLALIPSKVQDAAPLAAIETMTTGTPLITTNRGGIPEYVGDAAILLSVDEHLSENLAGEIERLLSDPRLLEEYGKRGKERAALFTKKRFFDRFVEIVNEIENTGKNV